MRSGLLEIGEKAPLLTKASSYRMAFKSYLGNKPAHWLKSYVALGWTGTKLTTREMEFRMMDIYSRESKNEYRIIEKIIFGEKKKEWASSVLLDVGCRLQVGPGKRLFIDGKYHVKGEKYPAIVSYDSYGGVKKLEPSRFQFSMGLVF